MTYNCEEGTESICYVDQVAMESMFDHIDVEDDSEAIEIEPQAAAPQRTAAEPQHASHSQPAASTSRPPPQHTAPSRYSESQCSWIKFYVSVRALHGRAASGQFDNSHFNVTSENALLPV